MPKKDKETENQAATESAGLNPSEIDLQESDVQGNQIPMVYVNEKLAEQFDAQDATKIAETCKERLGVHFVTIEKIIAVIRLIKENGSKIVDNQLDLLLAFQTLVFLHPNLLHQKDFRKDFVLVQCHLCKSFGVKIQGIQPWENYWIP